VSLFEIYKPTQGKNARAATFVTVMVIVVLGAYILSEQLSQTGVYLRYGIPTAIVVVCAALMFWIVNRPKSADFLIATEGEIKKVSWSSRKEIIGATKVVIITTLILSGILYGVDILLVFVFGKLGIVG